ncbi:hypothetical protein [Mycobacterium sp. GA-2829]|uniref:hypothetical protein n=1 Tax=Mycobacterium sp. GA-2829 TaxID=1772283 RepID=UPI00074005EB|nr:hypothetical protein [Mycobacterium sp. GA-2829]KUI38321.1 hypothetical protein AU194_27375 [Mycobacterium sp. GA-2829]
MQEALRDDAFGWETMSETANSASRSKKFLAAGVAVVGAGAVAVSPVTVTPTLPDIQVRAVELSAVVDPFTQLAASFEATVENLELWTTNLSNVTLPALQQILVGYPELLGDFVQVGASGVVDPLGTFAAIRGVFDTYAPIIESGNAAATAALQTAFENLPTVIDNTLNYLRNGEFVEAFSEVNIWFLVQLLERPFVPLVPTLGIPGDIADALGAETAGNVLDALFTRGGINGITKALLAPALTAVLQGAVVLDEVRAAYDDGDTAAALTGLATLPLAVANAFVNGFVPPFTTRSNWPGIFGDGGPVDYFTVDLPRILGNALKPQTPALLRAASTPAALESGDVASTEIGSSDTLTLDVATGTATAEKATAEKAATTTPAVEAEAPVAETPAAEDPETGAEVVPVADADPVTEAPEKTVKRPNPIKAFNDGVAKAVSDTKITLKKAFGGSTSKKESTTKDSDSKSESGSAGADKGGSDAKSDSSSASE